MMLKKYSLFLSRGSRFSILNHLRACANTANYYSQRRRLKADYKLRISDIPYLYRLQKNHDYLLEKTIVRSILQQKHSEEKEQFRKIAEQSKFKTMIEKFLEKALTERVKIKEQGVLEYLSHRLKEILRLINSRTTMESLSKWIVSYVNLYHKSLEEMVQGHRDVTRNHQTILKDGKTVEKKIKEFEEKIKNH